MQSLIYYYISVNEHYSAEMYLYLFSIYFCKNVENSHIMK